MASRGSDLIDQIERDALDESVPLASALRKCITLGGQSGSEQLRDWATRELKGYHGEDNLPDYRRIEAPLVVDAVTVTHKITGQQFPPSALPEFAREHVTNEVQLRDGVGQLEALTKQPQIHLMPHMATDLVRVMNSQGDPSQRIVALYWTVAHAAVHGALDQIRTSLTQLVAELRATMPRGEAVPSAEAADAAVHVAITGERNQVTVTTAQASDSATATVAPTDHGFWTRPRKIGAVIVGIATVVGAVAAVVAIL